MKLFDLYATLGLDSRAFNTGLSSARGQFNSFAASLNVGIGKTGRSLGGLVTSAAHAMSSLTQTVQKGVTVTAGAMGTLMSGLAVTGVKYNSLMENYQMDFTTLLGSADEAQKKVNELRALDLSSPLGMDQLAGATKLMLSFGIEAEEVSDKLGELSDISMGNAEKLNSLTLAYSQIRSVGKLTMMDLRQMANQGFNPLKVVAEKTGVAIGDLQDFMSYGKPSKDMTEAIKAANAEVKAMGDNASVGAKMLAEMGETGVITSDIVSEAITIATSAGGQFYKATENAAKTLTGQLSILQGGVKKLIGSGFEPLSENLTENILPNLNEFIEELDTAFNRRGGGADGLTGMFAVVRDELVEMRDDTDEWTERAKQGVIRTSVLFNNTGKLVNGMLPSMLEAGGEIWGQVQIGFENAIPNLRKSAALVGPDLLAFFAESNADLFHAGLEIIGGLAEGIEDDFSEGGEGKIKTAVHNGIGKIAGWVSDEGNKESLSNAARFLLKTLADAAVEYAPEIFIGVGDIILRTIFGEKLGSRLSTSLGIATYAAGTGLGDEESKNKLTMAVLNDLQTQLDKENAANPDLAIIANEYSRLEGLIDQAYAADDVNLFEQYTHQLSALSMIVQEGNFGDATEAIKAAESIANGSTALDPIVDDWAEFGAEVAAVNDELRETHALWQMLLGPTPGTDYGNLKNLGTDALAPAHSLRSHATGLDYVPYNEYIARLHEGEAVLTKEQAERWRRGEDDTMMVVQTPQETRPIVLMIDGTEIGAVMYDNMNRRIENGNLQQIFGMGG